MYIVEGEYTIEELASIVREHSVKYFGRKIVSPEVATEYLQSVIMDTSQESFGILYLDNAHHIIDFRIEFTGTIDMCPVYPREIIKQILALDASAIILAHNHPAGSTNISSSDIEITKKIKDACEVIDCRLIDHIINANAHSHVSLQEHGYV